MVQFIPYDVASRLIMAGSIVSSTENYTLTDLSNALAKSFSIQGFAMAAATPFTLTRVKIYKSNSLQDTLKPTS